MPSLFYSTDEPTCICFIWYFWYYECNVCMCWYVLISCIDVCLYVFSVCFSCVCFMFVWLPIGEINK